MCKTICIHKSIFNNKSNDRKIINNYLNFLNKANVQTFLKKSTASNILGRREYILYYSLRDCDFLFTILILVPRIPIKLMRQYRAPTSFPALLKLSTNNLNMIPAEIGELKALTELDFSGNKLHGEIPPSNLQSHKLEGSRPSPGTTSQAQYLKH